MKTISQISREYGISTRALRYYEQEGILNSVRPDDYAYRVYDDESIRRIQQIIVLRKLRIPIKHIGALFKNNDAEIILNVFTDKLAEIDEEISDLTNIRFILTELTDGLRYLLKHGDGAKILRSDTVMKYIDKFSVSTIDIKDIEEMKELKNLLNTTQKLDNVRIVHIRPCTVASYRAYGEFPEEAGGEVVEKFLNTTNLYNIMPEARQFGFNNPPPTKEKSAHGYETWITIPEDLDVPSPLIKKQFGGGMYAAHTIKLGDFHEWQRLKKWVYDNDKYEPLYKDNPTDEYYGCLEEGLNYVYYSSLNWPDWHEPQLDLLFPVKLKNKA